MPISFEIQRRCGSARAGLLRTDHGEVETPAFMPVGTQAAVKASSPETLEEAGVQMVLANAYHLMLRPGADIVEESGGLHRFMSWKRPILTDSGGFQVLSLAALRNIGEEGITFRSHIDGSLHLFTPERVIESQMRMGADFIMSFDYCTESACNRAEAERAVELTTRWAKRGSELFGTRIERKGHEQALFGIVQGGAFRDLRRRSLDEMLEIDFPGFAIGGLSVGEHKDETWELTELVCEGLPSDRPRYLMGMGTPVDLVEGVARGIDLFDCVLPTRNARNGTVFTRNGRVVLKNASFAADFSPLDEACTCYTCRNFSRAYLRHLFLAGEILGPMLATRHSLYFYCEVMRDMRASIERGDFPRWRTEFVERFTSGAVDRARSA